MQRCSQAWTPLFRAGLQAAATTHARRYRIEQFAPLTGHGRVRYSTAHNRYSHDSPGSNVSGDTSHAYNPFSDDITTHLAQENEVEDEQASATSSTRSAFDDNRPLSCPPKARFVKTSRVTQLRKSPKVSIVKMSRVTQLRKSQLRGLIGNRPWPGPPGVEIVKTNPSTQRRNRRWIPPLSPLGSIRRARIASQVQDHKSQRSASPISSSTGLVSHDEDTMLWHRTAEAVKQTGTGDAVPVESIFDDRVHDWIDTFADRVNLQKRWMQSLLYLLAHDQDRAMDLLQAAHGQLNVKREWIADALELLAAHCSQQEELTAQATSTRILELCQKWAQPKGRLYLSTQCFEGFVPYLTADQLVVLHRLLYQLASPPRSSRLLITRRAAELGELPLAVNVFLAALRLHPAGGPGDSAVLVALLSILKALLDQPKGWHLTLRLVDNLHQHALEISTLIANKMLRHVAATGRVSLTMRMYQLLFSGKGLSHRQPDAYTFAMLLKVHEHSAVDKSSLLETVNELRRHKANLISVVLANDILNRIAKYFIQEQPQNAWRQICALWIEQFNPDPLLSLGLPLEGIEMPTKASAQEPDQYSISILIHAYVKLHGMGYLQESDPVDVYKSFHSLVLQGITPFKESAKIDHVYNSFLTCFIKNKETLINATDLIKDMQSLLPADAGFEKTLPTIQSWNIFLLGFQMHEKPVLAEQIVTYMESIGIEPNQVTWNQLVSDYSGEGDLQGMMDALGRAQAAGAQWTEYINEAIANFRDKDALRDALTKHRDEVALDFSDEIKDSMGARLEQGDSTPDLPQLEDEGVLAGESAGESAPDLSQREHESVLADKNADNTSR